MSERERKMVRVAVSQVHLRVEAAGSEGDDDDDESEPLYKWGSLLVAPCTWMTGLALGLCVLFILSVGIVVAVVFSPTWPMRSSAAASAAAPADQLAQSKLQRPMPPPPSSLPPSPSLHTSVDMNTSVDMMTSVDMHASSVDMHASIELDLGLRLKPVIGEASRWKLQRPMPPPPSSLPPSPSLHTSVDMNTSVDMMTSVDMHASSVDMHASIELDLGLRLKPVIGEASRWRLPDEDGACTCMRVYARVCTCMHVYAIMHVYTRVHLCKCARVHVCTYARTHLCTYARRLAEADPS